MYVTMHNHKGRHLEIQLLDKRLNVYHQWQSWEAGMGSFESFFYVQNISLCHNMITFSYPNYQNLSP